MSSVRHFCAAICIVAATSAGGPVQAVQQSACPVDPRLIQQGFDTAEDLRGLSDRDLATYARGFVNGVGVAALFGAPKTCVDDRFACVLGKSDVQLAAILRKRLAENPEEWHWTAAGFSYRHLFADCG